jgi:hypothetical protein
MLRGPSTTTKTKHFTCLAIQDVHTYRVEIQRQFVLHSKCRALQEKIQAIDSPMLEIPESPGLVALEVTGSTEKVDFSTSPLVFHNRTHSF